MSTNGFREDELITKRVNGQVKIFPVVAGRLRLAHTENKSLSLQTEMVSWDGQYAVFKCCAVTGKGQFIGYGTANSQRDARLAESLVELAETRSIARALRFAGYGMEFTSAEEISHVTVTEHEQEQRADKESKPVFPEHNRRNKPEAKSNGNGNGKADPPNGAAVAVGSKPQRCGIGNGRCSQAQCRALFALTKKARYGEEDIANLLRPMNAPSFENLTRQDASRLISHLQAETSH